MLWRKRQVLYNHVLWNLCWSQRPAIAKYRIWSFTRFL